MPSPMTALVLALVGLPFAGAALVGVVGGAGRQRDALVVAASSATLVAAVALVPVASGVYPLHVSVPFLLAEATLTLDLFAHLLTVVVAFVWTCCAVHSLDYLRDDDDSSRFHVTALATLGATMGVVLAGDLVTLFLAFELMGLLAYLFVVHKRTGKAERAAAKYLVLTIASGFLLLAGVLLTFHIGGGDSLAPVPFQEDTSALRWLAAALLVLGFGVKAGMLPVHIWLPDAHSVAPSPASALLSGVLIKTGAYGILRTLYMLLVPAEGIDLSVDPSAAAGLVLLVVGLTGAIAGVAIALAQDDMKRMLAYSSISQIGFVIAGLGAAAYLTGDRSAAYGLSGSLYHIVNHALYKAALFLGAGAVLKNAGTTELRRLGGLWRSMPKTLTVMVVATAGITGLPLLNGFVSKSLLHHAVEAAEPVRLLGAIGPFEAAFVLAGGGTVAVLAKLLWMTFGGPANAGLKKVADASPRMLAGMVALSAAMLAIGWAPLVLLHSTITPAVQGFGLDPSVLVSYRQFTWEHAGFSLLALAMGAAIFALDARVDVSRARVPRWASIDYWYDRSIEAGLQVASLAGTRYEAHIVSTSRAIRSASASASLMRLRWRRARQRAIATIVEGSPDRHAAIVFQHISDVLEDDRVATVEHAVAHAEERQREAPACPGRGCDEYIDAVRDIVDYTAWRVRNDRIATATRMVRSDPERSLEAVEIALREAGDRTRETIIAAVHDLALRRMAGENVIPHMSTLVVRILHSEDFAGNIARTMPPGWHTQGPLGPSPTVQPDTSPSASPLPRTLGAWITDIVQLVVAAFTRERTDWGEDRPEQERIVTLRRVSNAVTRDLDLALSIMLVVLLAVLLAAR